jgi:chromosome partitioning protein
VGKTTTALNLGYSLSLAGSKVLIIDGDPQGGVALAVNLKTRTAKGLVHALKNNSSADENVIEFLKKDSLAVAGVGIEQPEDIHFFEQAADDGSLGTLIKKLAVDFEYVLIDAPVGVGRIVKALLEVSDSYLLMINCKAGTVKSLPRLIKLAEWLKKNVNSNLELEGIITTMFDNKSQSEQKIYNHFKARLPEEFFLNTVIPFDSKFELASIKAIPVALLADGRSVAEPYMNLALEIQSHNNQSEQTENAQELLNKNSEAGYQGTLGIENQEETFKSNILKDILAAMCERGDLYGTVIADEMGFPLDEYNSPVSTEALAAFTSVLNDTLEKADSILDMQNANNLSMDINENDKLILRKFEVLNSTYYLLAVCPQEAQPLGEMQIAVSKIISKLS